MIYLFEVCHSGNLGVVQWLGFLASTAGGRGLVSGGGSVLKNLLECRRRKAQVLSLGWEDPLEEEMAPHSSILVWKIPWTEEPGGLKPIGSQRVEHN